MKYVKPEERRYIYKRHEEPIYVYKSDIPDEPKWYNSYYEAINEPINAHIEYKVEWKEWSEWEEVDENKDSMGKIPSYSYIEVQNLTDMLEILRENNKKCWLKYFEERKNTIDK